MDPWKDSNFKDAEKKKGKENVETYLPHDPAWYNFHDSLSDCSSQVSIRHLSTNPLSIQKMDSKYYS